MHFFCFSGDGSNSPELYVRRSSYASGQRFNLWPMPMERVITKVNRLNEFQYLERVVIVPMEYLGFKKIVLAQEHSIIRLAYQQNSPN